MKVAQDIVNHVENLEINLALLSSGQRGKFAAWCVHALASDVNIIRQLALLTHSSAALSLIHQCIQISWNGTDDIESIQTLKKKIDTILWEEDSDCVDDVLTQGCIELLGATDSMLGGLIESNISMQANCAERVINWLDCLNDFALLEDESLIENEYRIQNQFLSIIKRDTKLSIQFNFLRKPYAQLF